MAEKKSTEEGIAYAVWQSGRPPAEPGAPVAVKESDAFLAGWDAREARIGAAPASALTFVLEGWNITMEAEIQEGPGENGWITVAPTGRCLLRSLSGVLVGSTQATMSMTDLGKVAKRIRVTLEPADE